MPKIRTIKPQIWSSTPFRLCSYPARLLFIGLITYADDFGKLAFDPGGYRGWFFPDDNIAMSDLSQWIEELVSLGLTYVYQGNSGAQYLLLPKFRENQYQRDSAKSKIPDPDWDEVNEFLEAAEGRIQKKLLEQFSGELKIHVGGVQNGYKRLNPSEERINLSDEREKTSDERIQVAGKERKGREGIGLRNGKEGKASPSPSTGSLTRPETKTTAKAKTFPSDPEKQELEEDGPAIAADLALRLLSIRFGSTEELKAQLPEHWTRFTDYFESITNEEHPTEYWDSLLDWVMEGPDDFYRTKCFRGTLDAERLLLAFKKNIENGKLIKDWEKSIRTHGKVG